MGTTVNLRYWTAIRNAWSKKIEGVSIFTEVNKPFFINVVPSSEETSFLTTFY